MVELNGVGGRIPLLVGTPADIADELQSWVAETDVGGFNLSYAVMPGSYVDIVDLVITELQRRGIYKTDYAPGHAAGEVFGRHA